MLKKAIEAKHELLKSCILKGSCPRCLSKNIEYREPITNQIFKFQCQKCAWQEDFTVENLMQFARYWI